MDRMGLVFLAALVLAVLVSLARPAPKTLEPDHHGRGELPDPAELQHRRGSA